MKSCLLIILALACAPVLAEAAVEVVAGNVSFGPDSTFGSNYRATTLQAPSFDNTSVWFNFTPSLTPGSVPNTLRVSQWNLDEESDWYLVKPGNSFGVTSIAMASDPILFTVDNARPAINIPLGDVYLGVATAQGFGDRDVFGWLRLNNTGIALQYVDSAVAYGADGIVVGTLTAVPEPAALVLAVASILAVTISGRRWGSNKS